MAELILALDLPDGEAALGLVDRLAGLRWAKVGSAMFTRDGPRVVRALRDRGINVFLDLKWHDIPSVVVQAVEGAKALGVQLATVHALGGAEMLRAAAAVGLDLAAVTLLTSHTPMSAETIFGRGVPDLGAEAIRLGRLALAAGLRGVVASPHEVAALREALGRKPWIVVPGIRRPGDEPGDQARAATPGEAVRAGATHLVVGRPILHADDPVAAYRSFIEAIA